MHCQKKSNINGHCLGVRFLPVSFPSPSCPVSQEIPPCRFCKERMGILCWECTLSPPWLRSVAACFMDPLNQAQDKQSLVLCLESLLTAQEHCLREVIYCLPSFGSVWEPQRWSQPPWCSPDTSVCLSVAEEPIHGRDSCL